MPISLLATMAKAVIDTVEGKCSKKMVNLYLRNPLIPEMIIPEDTKVETKNPTRRDKKSVLTSTTLSRIRK